MKSANLKVEYVPIASLKLHPDNPRIIKGEQFKVLCDSLKANPDYFETRPILANEELVVFAGNMRLRAAMEIGLKEVPVVIMRITPERERELMVRDNVQSGEWNTEILANNYDVAELVSFGMDPTALGMFESSPDDSPEPETKTELCNRCEELKTQVEAHEKRSGHKVMPGSTTGDK